MIIVLSLLAVIVLLLLAFIGVDVVGWQYFFGVIMPMATIVVFIIGIVYRVIKWARSPVPFRITTTCGQQKSLPWFKANNLESPYNIWGVLGRMCLEVFFFRSLFRNTKVGLKEGPRLVYGSTKWLWLGGLVFHWSFLVVFIRHFKFFAEPVPTWVLALQNLDGFFQIGLPIIYATDIAFLAALTFLFLRRVVDPKLRYISLAADYFPLFLIMSIAVTGILMRYFTKVDIIGIKQMAMGWLSLSPVVPEGISSLFFMHLFLLFF